MRLVRLTLENFRSHERLDLDLGAIRAAAIVGRNGAGKSSILVAVDFALFGGPADDLLRHGAGSGGVTLELDVGGVTWRIARGRDRGRKSWLVVERDGVQVGGKDIKDRQAVILRDVVGMDGESFAASVYAPQGQAGMLAALSPGQRKALLGGLLGLERYEVWRESAAAEARSATERATVVAGQAERLLLRRGEVQPVADALAIHEQQFAIHESRMAELEAALEAAAARAVIVEQVQRRRELVELMDRLKVEGTAAKGRNATRAALSEDIASRGGARTQYEALAEEHAELMQQEADARASRAGAQATLDRVAEQVRSLAADVAALSLRAGGLAYAADVAREELLAVEAVDAGVACPTCGQPVEGDAHARVVADRDERIERARARCEETASQLADARRHLKAKEAEHSARAEEASVQRQLVERAPAGHPPTYDRAPYEAAAAAVRELDRLEGQREGMGPVEDIKEIRARWDALKVEVAALPKQAPSGPSAASLREERARVASEATQAREAAQKARAATEEISRIDGEVGGLEVAVAEQRTLARARQVLAKACSRQGIPAMILDGAVAGIEQGANDCLAHLGSQLRIRLATQVQRVDGKGMKEALEILVDDGIYERALDTFSGGEAYRVHVALRIGLASMLAAGSGRACDVLLIDEPTDLDRAGMAALSELLAGVDRQVLLVTHQDELTTAMPQRITVHRDSEASPSRVSVS